MKVLVTGGAGFIGSHVVDGLLVSGHSVTVLDNFVSGRLKNLATAKEISKRNGAILAILRGDVSNPKIWQKLALKKWDALIHFAAQTSVTASVSNPELDFKTNVDSVLYISKFLQKAKVRYLLFANTAGAMYGEVEAFPTGENQVCNPTAPYGATKNFFESYISALCKSLKAAKLWSSNPQDKNYFSWASLRLSNVYGPRQITKGEAGVVPIFIESFLKGKQPTIFGDGTKSRDYVYVSDVASAFLTGLDELQVQALDCGFNVSTGVEVTDHQVFETLKDALHLKSKDSKKFQKALGVSTPKYAPIRPGELVRSCLDNSKIQKRVWKNRMLMPFSKGARETVDYYLQFEVAK